MAGKRHEKRFIIEVKKLGGKWFRSGNYGLRIHFPTREDAQIALDTPGFKSPGMTYRIRQK